ncbi:MAG: hypothetical protein ACKORL_02260, partial [Phycisphaerales bacterium]
MLQDRGFLALCLALTSLSVLALCILLTSIAVQGWSGLLDADAARAVFMAGELSRGKDLVRWSFFSEFA